MSNTRCRVWRSLAGPGRPQHLPACCHTQWQSVAGAAPPGGGVSRCAAGLLWRRRLLLLLLRCRHSLRPPLTRPSPPRAGKAGAFDALVVKWRGEGMDEDAINEELDERSIQKAKSGELRGASGVLPGGTEEAQAGP